MKKLATPWQDRIINPRALGGIETAVLDNGPGRGTRVAWVDTGSGLRFRVALDRGLDIYEAFFGRHGLAFLAHAGLTTPRPDANRGLEWLSAFGGGLVTTCGLTHVGPPEDDPACPRGLHGRASSLVAELESVTQPDPFAGQAEMAISGLVKESRLFGSCLEMRRTIRATLGRSVIRIEDRVTNRGGIPSPHMLLYHCNLGWPLVDAGARIVWKGSWRSRGNPMDDAIFRAGGDFRTCPPPLESHRAGEGCGFVDVQADRAGLCTVGLHNPRLGLALAIRYPKKALPAFTNWQHWGFGDYVTGLEPGTNPPIGQAGARKEGTLVTLEPGESRDYVLEIEVLDDPAAIKGFLAKADQEG